MCNECDYDRSDAVVGWLSSQTIKNGGPSQKLNKKSISTFKANSLTELETRFRIIDCFKNETQVGCSILKIRRPRSGLHIGPLRGPYSYLSVRPRSGLFIGPRSGPRPLLVPIGPRSGPKKNLRLKTLNSSQYLLQIETG